MKRRTEDLPDFSAHDAASILNCADTLLDGQADRVYGEQFGIAGRQLEADAQKERAGTHVAERGTLVAPDEVARPIGVVGRKLCHEGALAEARFGREQHKAAAVRVQTVVDLHCQPIAPHEARIREIALDERLKEKIT